VSAQATNVPPIRSARLELVSMSPAFLEAALGGRAKEAGRVIDADVPGDAVADEARFFRLRLEQMRKEPARRQWLRAIVRTERERAMVGHTGFHGPPGTNGRRDPGALEIGYTVFEPFRGQGYASEAAAALIGWAHAEHGIRKFIASVAPGNEPSLAIVRKLGFVQAGEWWDEEDGLELVFELERL
jgi:RimJ/RimL family protein N-acetyltransferase